MRKLAFILLLILMPSSLAYSTILVRRTGGGGGNGCPSATYDSAWTGDTTALETDICANSGASLVNYESQSGDIIDSAYGQTGKGARITSDQQYHRWPVTSDDIMDEEEGTWFASIRLSAIPTARCGILMAFYNTGTDLLWVSVESGGKIRGQYIGQGAAASNVRNDDRTITADGSTWNRIAYSWDRPNDDHDVYVDNGTTSGWDEDPNDIMTQWTAEVTDAEIGLEIVHAGACGANIDIDDVYFVPSYHAEDPMP